MHCALEAIIEPDGRLWLPECAFPHQRALTESQD